MRLFYVGRKVGWVNDILKSMDRMPCLDKLRFYDYTNQRIDFSTEVNEEYDALLVTKGTFEINPDWLRKIKKPKILYYNDPIHKEEEELSHLKQFYDHRFVANYEEEAIKKGFKWVPFGIDEANYFDWKLDRTIDVSSAFYAYNWIRVEWVKELKKAYPPFKLFGDNWDNFGVPNILQARGYGYIKLLNRSKITINNHYGASIKRAGVNTRFFEAMGCKSLLMNDKCTGIPPDFKEGVHFVSYGDIPDLIKKCKYYLANEPERLKIVENAYKLVREKYKYSDTFTKIFKLSGLIK